MGGLQEFSVSLMGFNWVGLGCGLRNKDLETGLDNISIAGFL